MTVHGETRCPPVGKNSWPLTLATSSDAGVTWTLDDLPGFGTIGVASDSIILARITESGDEGIWQLSPGATWRRLANPFGRGSVQIHTGSRDGRVTVVGEDRQLAELGASGEVVRTFRLSNGHIALRIDQESDKLVAVDTGYILPDGSGVGRVAGTGSGLVLTDDNGASWVPVEGQATITSPSVPSATTIVSQ